MTLTVCRTELPGDRNGPGLRSNHLGAPEAVLRGPDQTATHPWHHLPWGEETRGGQEPHQLPQVPRQLRLLQIRSWGITIFTCHHMTCCLATCPSSHQRWMECLDIQSHSLLTFWANVFLYKKHMMKCFKARTELGNMWSSKCRLDF